MSYKLPGGEKRAAAIATVLSLEPDVLALDEPSAALIKLLQGFEQTKLIATHDLDMVLDLYKANHKKYYERQYNTKSNNGGCYGKR